MSRFPPARARAAALVPVGLVWWPVPTLGLAALFGVLRRLVRLAEARRRATAADSDVVALAELSILGLAAGLNLSQSLRLAAAPLVAPVRHDVDVVLRRSRLVGLSAALAADTSRCSSLFRLVSRAVDSGAPVRGAVEAYVEDRISDQRARALSAARRLPVKLLFPLALLILPGFMVLTVGPALVGSVERLGL